MGLVENSLPTFWNTDLSHVSAISDPIMDERLPKKPSKAEKISRAKMLDSIGTPVSQIMTEIGVRSRYGDN